MADRELGPVETEITPYTNQVDSAAKGEQVRGSISTAIKKIAQAVDDAVGAQVKVIDSTLSNSGQGADAKVVGDILYTSSDHTGITPWPTVRFSGTVENLTQMPPRSWMTIRGNDLKTVLGEGFAWASSINNDYYVVRKTYGTTLYEIQSLDGLQHFYGKASDSATTTFGIAWFNNSVDNSFTIAGAPADSQAVGELAWRSVKMEDILANNTDLNDVDDGNYILALSPAYTYVNTPSQLASNSVRFLFVFRVDTNAATVMQICTDSTGQILSRLRLGGSWTDWVGGFDSTLLSAKSAVSAKTLGDLMYNDRDRNQNVPIIITDFTPDENFETLFDMPPFSRMKCSGLELKGYLNGLNFDYESEFINTATYIVDHSLYITNSNSSVGVWRIYSWGGDPIKEYWGTNTTTHPETINWRRRHPVDMDQANSGEAAEAVSVRNAIDTMVDVLNEIIFENRDVSVITPHVPVWFKSSAALLVSSFDNIPKWSICSMPGTKLRELITSNNTDFPDIKYINNSTTYIIEKDGYDSNPVVSRYLIYNSARTHIWSGRSTSSSAGVVYWEKILSPSDSDKLLPQVVNNFNNSFEKDDFLFADIEIEEDKNWWTNSGSHATSGSISKPIPIDDSRPYYTMFFGGSVPQSCGGAFLNANGNWLAPIKFPYNGGEAENVEEYEYRHSDVTSEITADETNKLRKDAEFEGGLTFPKMWKIIPPEGACYVSLNIRTSETEPTPGTTPGVTHSSTYKYVQSLSTLPVIGFTGSGNYIWRHDDPIRQAKKKKKLYVIGPSTAAIDKAYLGMYTYDPANPYPTNYNVVYQPLVGFQEYLRPYYRDMVILGFNGIGYRYPSEANTTDRRSILHFLQNDQYELAEGDLTDADEVIIMPNGNNWNIYEDQLNPGQWNNGELGNWDDTVETSTCGAINTLIDLIYSKNVNHPVTIYLMCRVVRGSNDPEAEFKYRRDYNKCIMYNEQIREIAKHRQLPVIDMELCGMNPETYGFYTYDSQRTDYVPYGGHPNNLGSRIWSQKVLSTLLHN